MTYCQAQIGPGLAQGKQQGDPLLRKDKPPVGVAVRKILPQYLFLGRSQETTRGMAVGPESSPHHGIGDRLPGDRVGDSAAHPSRCVGHGGATEGSASTEQGCRE